MLDDAAAVAALFNGSVLGGRPVERIPVPGGDQVALAVRCDPAEMLPAWETARALVPTTGRWPVATSAFGYDLAELVTNRAFFEHGAASHGDPGGDSSSAAIIERSRTIDPEVVLRALAARDEAHDGYAHERLQTELGETQRALGTAPTETEARAALGPRTSWATIDRWLLTWEQMHGGGSIKPPDGLDMWFEPTARDGAGLLLLPTEHGWEVPAFLSFFGALDPGGPESLIAVLHRWHERWGAELAYAYLTMLQFVVRRPPRSVDEAWTAVREHDLIGPESYILTGIPRRMHARAIVGRERWFVQCKP